MNGGVAADELSTDFGACQQSKVCNGVVIILVSLQRLTVPYHSNLVLTRANCDGLALSYEMLCTCKERCKAHGSVSCIDNGFACYVATRRMPQIMSDNVAAMKAKGTKGCTLFIRRNALHNRPTTN